MLLTLVVVCASFSDVLLLMLLASLMELIGVYIAQIDSLNIDLASETI